MAAELFADGFVGEHGDQELCDAWFSHAGFVGSFAPIVQYEKWEIYPVFPHFSYVRLCQNLSPNLLAPLYGGALIANIGEKIAIPANCWYDIDKIS